METLFPTDVMSKRERVLATLRHQPVDRCALLEQLSYNPRVIAEWTGKTIEGFDYTLDDICTVCRQSMDVVMPPAVLKNRTDRVTSAEGFVYQYDNWTVWTVSRPFQDEAGACAWLEKRICGLRAQRLDGDKARQEWRLYMRDLQGRLGETLIMAYPVHTGLCTVYGDSGMGLELFSYVCAAGTDRLREFLDLHLAQSLARLHAIADEYAALSPIVLVAEDFSTKQGPIFSPEFLHAFHYPYVKAIVDAWHEHGLHVIYHSDGNYRKALPDLIACGADGFYCLEPNCGMNIVELKTAWPELVWAGGVDGVDLLERGTPEQVRAEVRRHILETRALDAGGMFVASSSEINPPIPPENFRAMVEAVATLRRNVAASGK
jgi:uroporphyrinogen decarboxylase